MTRSVYVLGGAGTGKSTFTAALLEDCKLAPLEDLHAKQNRKAMVTLRGHRTDDDGLYLGVMRDLHPGTDGLDRASGPTGEEWLRTAELPRWILSEGQTLSTRGFLTALHETTDLLVVLLVASDEEKLRRYGERGTEQDLRFALKQTVTRASNRATEMRAAGAKVMTVDTQDVDAWNTAIDISSAHLYN